VKVWHYDLVAEMDTEAYVAIAIGGQIEWEATIPIPSTGNLLEADIVMDRELPAGTPMQFHVHNHGPNSWELFDVMVTPEADAG
jgi:hypothetical protein